MRGTAADSLTFCDPLRQAVILAHGLSALPLSEKIG